MQSRLKTFDYEGLVTLFNLSIQEVRGIYSYQNLSCPKEICIQKYQRHFKKNKAKKKKKRNRTALKNYKTFITPALSS